MKERIVLTTTSERAYHGVRTMAENQGEAPKAPPAGGPKAPQTPSQTSVGEEVGEPGRRWVEEHGLSSTTEGRPTKETPEFKQARREALERGELTVSGSQEFTDLPHTGNATLDAIVAQVNSLTLEQRADLGSIERQLGRVERLVDEGRVPTNVASQVVNNLEKWKTLVREIRGMTSRRPEPFELHREGEIIQEDRLRAIVERAEQTLGISPDVGTSTTWLEGLYNEIGGVHSRLLQEREEVGRGTAELYRLADKEGWENAELDRRLEGLRERQKGIEANIASTEGHMDRVLERTRQLPPVRRDEQAMQAIEELDGIKSREGEYVWRRALKEYIIGLNVEAPIDIELFRYIARDEEASEMFWDRIVSKPFIHPDVPYREGFGFYGGINKLEFLDALRAVDPKRHLNYVRLSESSERLHEFNRVVFAESGNPEAYTSFSRSITHQHLQTATELDGVELVRQLYERAYGRLYSKTERVTSDNYEPEIEQWVRKRFHELVEMGRVKSRRHTDEHGAPRNLEPWEEERAFAFGRNISTSFYRQSELISWSKIPRAWERWIESLPTETVVRAMGGLKWLTYRFRIATFGGGEWLASSILKKVKGKYEGALKKVGKLDIKDELYPVGFFKGAGFDKGWRIFQAYLRNDVMRIKLDPLPPLSEEERRRMIPEQRRERDDRENFFKEFGNRPTLGDFIFEHEYMAQFVASEKAKIAGVEIPEELRRFDRDKLADLLAKELIPLLGWRVKDPEKVFKKGYKFKIGDFDYDGNLDQIHLNFGTLISFGAANETVKALLWTKAAEVLPLRMAYILSEEGVERIDQNGKVHKNGGVRQLLESPRYNHLKGDGDNLFSDEFELKLIILERQRMVEQIEEQKLALQERRPARQIPLRIDDPTIGLFIKKVQELGRKSAPELAKIDFPHVPFHDDTTYQDADYTTLRGETFPRRQGGDFAAFVNVNSEFNTIVSHLGELPYDGVLEHLAKIRDGMSTPENYQTGQDVALPILQSYLELAKQWIETQWPSVKTIKNFFGLPASHMQQLFGPNAAADDASELNVKVRKALEKGIVRREKEPGKKESQVDQLLRELGGKWYNVIWRELRNALLIYFLLMTLKFGGSVAKEK